MIFTFLVPELGALYFIQCHRTFFSNRGGSLSFLVGTISDVLVMEIGWTDVGGGGYILLSCAHTNTSYYIHMQYELV
jgi:hypothetical protein